jgi:hypothetical protein
MRLTSALTAFGLCVIAQRAPAQTTRVDPLAIPTGTEARITETSAPQTRLRVTMMATDQDTLRFHLLRQADQRAVPWREVNQMDVVGGSHGHFWQGLGIGLAAGAIIGAIAGSSGASGNDGETPAAMGALGAIGGGIAGAIAGGVIGIIYRTDRWMPVSVPRRGR